MYQYAGYVQVADTYSFPERKWFYSLQIRPGVQLKLVGRRTTNNFLSYEIMIHISVVWLRLIYKKRGQYMKNSFEEKFDKKCNTSNGNFIRQYST